MLKVYPMNVMIKIYRKNFFEQYSFRRAVQLHRWENSSRNKRDIIFRNLLTISNIDIKQRREYVEKSL